MKLILRTCLLAGGVLAILVIGSSSLSGIKVEIENLGPTAMKNVAVDVTGASYSIGDIPAGTSRWVKVKPRSESSVSIRQSDNTEKERTLFIDTYIEGGYSGKITAQVKNGKITRVKQNIKLTPISGEIKTTRDYAVE